MGILNRVESSFGTKFTCSLKKRVRNFRKTIRIKIGSAALMALSACSGGTNTSSGVDTAAIINSLRITAISVEEATLLQCPAGGKVYSVYIDADRDNVRSSSEAEISGQIICNGVNGSDGKNSLIKMTGVQTESCPSGSGLQIDVGLDSNQNALLAATEITQTEILCNGANGEPGAAGPAGANGHSMVFQSVPASEQSCPNGGVTTLMALDVEDEGVYSVDLPKQYAATICNGSNGQDGADGADGADGQDGQNALVSAYTPVEVLVPCASTSAYKEVLLRLQDGSVLASFSDNSTGQNTRFTILPNGNFRTTDGNACDFSLSASGDGLTRQFSWGGQIRKSWPMP